MLDYFDLSEFFPQDEKDLQISTREFLEEKVKPYVANWWEEGVFPTHLINELGKRGLLGLNLPVEFGGQGLSALAYGLAMYELERIDSALRSFVSVQSSLVMYPIFVYGSDEQRSYYLPKMASGELIGCFGLTESSGGSDPSTMGTRAVRDGDDYVLTGSKIWITNGSIADVAVIWARDEEGEIRGFLVDTSSPGFSTEKIPGKMSMRAAVTSELILEDVRISSSQLLPSAKGLRSPLSCLTQARYSIVWGALGALEAVYREVCSFAQERKTFGQPIASRQLVQAKLVHLLSSHTKGLLLAWRLSQLKDKGSLDFGQVSLAKRDNVRCALEGARIAREILGANGITIQFETIRHMLNLETLDTYEGTYDIHTLIVGREITGFNAMG